MDIPIGLFAAVAIAAATLPINHEAPMTKASPTCLDRESEFRLDELFFSTTDATGVIRSGNDVFVRVSGYAASELIGHPHSKIRHPDMPRGVFRLFWRMLTAGGMIVAYVKNRSQDGSYYWVLAAAAPIEGGYLSIRLKPSSPLFPVVQQVYRTVWEDEKAATAEGLSKDEVCQVGLASLMAELNRLGFADYESFMRHALTCEMLSRHAVLSRDHQRHARTTQRKQSVGTLNRLADVNLRCERLLKQMLDRLAQLGRCNDAFISLSRSMMQQSEAIGIAAMNAQVSANTPTIEAISQALGDCEKDNRSVIVAMSDAVGTLADSLACLSLNVSIAALQCEATSQFLRQMQTADDATVTALIPDVMMLLGESESRFGRLFDQMSTTDEWFRNLEVLTEKLHRNAKSIRFVRMAGVKESAQLQPGHAFGELFHGINVHVNDTIHLCSDLRQQVQSAKRTIVDVTQCRSSLLQEADTLWQLRDTMSAQPCG